MLELRNASISQPSVHRDHSKNHPLPCGGSALELLSSELDASSSLDDEGSPSLPDDEPEETDELSLLLLLLLEDESLEDGSLELESGSVFDEPDDSEGSLEEEELLLAHPSQQQQPAVWLRRQGPVLLRRAPKRIESCTSRT